MISNAYLDNESLQQEMLNTLAELDRALAAVLTQTPEDQPAVRARLHYLRVSLRSVFGKFDPLWRYLEERRSPSTSPLPGGRRRTDPPLTAS